ncbi:MAG: prepilin-type N-terminal cleavage/methylation domain-containing protein [Patescibacteria group bacterium]|nr:prepilin-type N-terminal cleavage/methylation domain-containing protein [Patescibacteria group bacterium]
MKRLQSRGFTLVEILITIAIIAVLTGIILMVVNGAKGKARDARRLVDLHSLALGLQVYFNEVGHYPVTDGWVSECDTPTGNWIPDSGDYTWNVKDLPQVPRDPLAMGCAPGSPYHYSYISTDGKTYQLSTQLEYPTPGISNSSGPYAFNGSYFQADTSPVAVNFSTNAQNPTSQNPIPLTVSFSRAVVDFTQASLSVLRGYISSFTQVLASLFNIQVTPTDNDQVVVSITGGTVHDVNGVGNTSAQFSITYDSLLPHPALSPDPLPGTVQGSFQVSVNFTVAVIDFSAADISIQNGSVSTLTGSGRDYTFTVVPSSPGVVSVFIPSGVTHSAAGNGNVASNHISTTYQP